MKRLLLFPLLAALQLLIQPACAQAPVLTQPLTATTTNASGTLAAGATFQSIWAAVTSVRGRAGCTIQNNGSHSMYVYFGAIASATTSNSAILAAGQALNCSVFGVALQDQVSIAGTISEAFYAAQW